jgi:hypothetical protein
MAAILSETDLEIRRLMRRAMRAQWRAQIECEGKVAFATYGAAMHVAKRRRTRQVKSRREPYKCPTCGTWHIGRPKETPA